MLEQGEISAIAQCEPPHPMSARDTAETMGLVFAILAVVMLKLVGAFE